MWSTPKGGSGDVGTKQLEPEREQSSGDTGFPALEPLPLCALGEEQSPLVTNELSCTFA